MRKHSILLIATALFLWGIDEAASSAPAKEPTNVAKTLKIELNAMEQQQNACRLSFVATNGMHQKLAKLVFELVMFEPAGKVLRLLSASFGSMPKSKMRLRQYDVPNLNCDDIGRILLNEVTVCKGEKKGDKLTPELCTSAASTSSRVKIPFDF